MNKKISLAAVLFLSSFIIGCGGSDSSSSTSTDTTTQVNSSATIVDSVITGLSYTTNSGLTGVTDENGKFYYRPDDKNVTFEFGGIKLATFDLNKLNADNLVLIGDLFGLDRNDTNDSNLLKTLVFLQSLDTDNNPNNGIDLNITEAQKISDMLDQNSSIDENLTSNDINVINSIIKSAGKTAITEEQAVYNYTTTLGVLNIVDFKPFVTTWELNSTDKTITIDTDPNYTYNYTVDWGDGNISENLTKTISHTYDSEGNVTIKITGIFPHFTTDENDTAQLIYINSWGNLNWSSFSHSFEKAINLELNTTDFPILVNVKDMSYMFADSDFNSNISNWNVSHVQNMSHMFYNNKTFNQPIGDWNVSNVTDMSHMFDGAVSFNQDISSWNVSNVTNMSYMFNNATSFHIDLNSWNVSNVTDTSYMLANSYMDGTLVSDWNVSNDTNMSHMFDGMHFFANYELNNWDVSNVKDMSFMFANIPEDDLGISAIEISNWNVSNVTNMKGMFYNNENIEGTNDYDDLSEWNVSNVTDMSYMFYNADKFNGNITAWNVSNVTDMSYMFHASNHEPDGGNAFNQPLNDWNVSKVTNMAHMFENCINFTQVLSDWNVSNVKDTSYMFYWAEYFNGDISGWDVSNDTNMSHMFSCTEDFNSSLQNWNVSNVRDMNYMFYRALGFSDQNLSDWNVSNVGDNNVSFIEDAGGNIILPQAWQ